MLCIPKQLDKHDILFCHFLFDKNLDCLDTITEHSGRRGGEVEGEKKNTGTYIDSTTPKY